MLRKCFSIKNNFRFFSVTFQTSKQIYYTLSGNVFEEAENAGSGEKLVGSRIYGEALSHWNHVTVINLSDSQQ